MKIAAALLDWLILVPLTLSQNSCRQEHQASYYIYNANVKINSYYCLPNNATSCGKLNNSRRVTNDHQDMLIRCLGSNRGKLVTLCEAPAKVNLLENRITLASNSVCEYDEENCYEAELGIQVFWKSEDSCPKVIQMGKYEVKVWRIGEGRQRQKFIRNTRLSLMLKNQTRLCGVDVWRTLHDGVVASPNCIKGSVKGNLLRFDDGLPKDCSATPNANEETNDSLLMSGPNKWYIYRYQADIKVYYCLSNFKHSCSSIGFGEVSQEDQQKLLERCKTFPSTSKVCQKTRMVNSNNTIEGLPADCWYSSGICPKFKAFWMYTDHCKAIEKLGEDQSHANQKIPETDSFKLTLSHEGKLCDKPVWYTDLQGFVASREELQFFQPSPIAFPEENEEGAQPTEPPPSNHQDHLATPKDQTITATPLLQFEEEDLGIQAQEINRLQYLLFCLVFLVLVCFFSCIFNIVVNFISLRSFYQRRIHKNRLHLLNCVSNSLTVRFYFAEEKQTKTHEDDPGANESVDNELYDMKFTKMDGKVPLSC